jgi:hypothetical protein
MRKFLVVALAAVLAAPVALGAAPADPNALLRIASKLAGLQAKAPVKVVVEEPQRFQQRRVKQLDKAYPRASQLYDEALYRSLGLIGSGGDTLRSALIEMQDRQGFYDPATRTAFVRRDKNDRATAVHELVHALQDQHFDLRRVTAVRGDRDAAFGAYAALEGHAALAAGKPQRRDAVSEASRLQTFLDLEHGFAYATGLRFALTLRNLGGKQAVLSALKRFPATTEQVFHLDAFLQDERPLAVVLPVDAGALKLAGDDTFGELDVRALLAVFGVPRLDKVGTGWGGGRSARYRGPAGDVTLVALDWDSPRDAAEWGEAVETYVNEAFDADEPGPPAHAACAATACWTIGDRSIAFVRSGQRTSLALARTLEPAVAVARAVVP